MKTKHTPGPWEAVIYDGAFDQPLIKSDHVVICRVHGMEDRQHEANAKLIAAAPELLDQLVKARKLLIQNGFRTWSYVIIDIDNAIKKATE